MKTVEISLYQLSTSYTILNEDYMEFDRMAQLLIEKLPAVTQIYIMDKSGMQIYKSSHIDTLGDRSDRTYFQEALIGNSYFSNVIISRSTNVPIVVHAQPIFRNGKIDGVIGVSIDLSFLSTDALQSHLGTTDDKVYGYIVDSNGHVIGHPDFSLVQEQFDASYLTPVIAVMSDEEGIGVYTFDNVEKLVAYTPSLITNWGVLFQIPKDEALKDVGLINNRLLLVGIGVVLVSILGVFIASLYIKKPIDKIIKMIASIKSDDAHIEGYVVQDNEFGLIEKELVSMSSEIRHSYDVLQDAVEERTIELKNTMGRLENTKSELIAANSQLKSLSLTDTLTGIPNRRSLDDFINNMWKYFKRNKEPVSFLMIDIDNFKQYNDTYGHQQGDKCLKLVATSIKGLLLRESDFLARYGGEEFIVILNNLDKEGVSQVANRVCRGVEALKLAHDSSDVSPFVTISIGVSIINNWEDISSELAINYADNMLYLAKNQGKNCYIIQD